MGRRLCPLNVTCPLGSEAGGSLSQWRALSRVNFLFSVPFVDLGPCFSPAGSSLSPQIGNASHITLPPPSLILPLGTPEQTPLRSPNWTPNFFPSSGGPSLPPSFPACLPSFQGNTVKSSLIDVRFPEHTIRPFRVQISMVFRMFRVVHPSILKHFHHTKQKPHDLWLLFTISSLFPATTDLSFSAYALFWTFYTNGIRKHMVSGDCLLSLSIPFSRDVHAVVCICASLLLWRKTCHTLC